MYKKTATKLTELLINKQIIDSDGREIYYYSFELLISTIVTSTFIILISIFFKQLFNTFIFFIGFILCRSFCGGYHAKKHTSCFIFTQSIFLSFAIIISFFQPINFTFPNIIISTINLLLILCLAPIDVPNKPFSVKEKSRYKKRSKIFIIFSNLLMLPASLIPIFSEKYFCYTCGIFAVSILIVLEKLKKFCRKEGFYD